MAKMVSTIRLAGGCTEATPRGGACAGRRSPKTRLTKTIRPRLPAVSESERPARRQSLAEGWTKPVPSAGARAMWKKLMQIMAAKSSPALIDLVSDVIARDDADDDQRARGAEHDLRGRGRP